MVKIAPYGSWFSPITASDVAHTAGSPQWVGQYRGEVWWTQPRAAEKGRLTLLRAAGGEICEMLPRPWNVRNRVHEYGGRPWVFLHTLDGDRVAFTHWDDQRVYLFDPDAREVVPQPITPEPPVSHGWRYGELIAGPSNTEVWCVRETVTGPRPTDIRRELVAIPVSGEEIRVLAATHHFMTAPKPSPDGSRLAWIGWDHPAMPWDGTELCVSPLLDGIAGPHQVVAGGSSEAVCQFEWDGDDALLVLNDPEGWWNLYRVGLDGTSRNLAPCTEELGGPLWQLGTSWFGALGEGRYAVIRRNRLAVLDEHTGTVSDVDSPLSVWSGLSTSDSVIAGVASGPRDRRTVVVGRPGETWTKLGAAERMHADYLSAPQERVFSDSQGNDIPAYVYPPHNPEFTAPVGEPPPYLVHVHGGPTGRVSGELQLDFAYFTSRGIGVVAVNYGGSVGYGRKFRERLREQWGVVDVADCAAVAEALAVEGSADGKRLAVRGGSAGGWTSAASLTSVSTYRCGTVMFPILDLAGWTGEGGETHDFESQYVYGLVGSPTRHPERYTERSPAHHADRLAGPVLMLQGLDDEICPPAQADRFMAGLAGSGIPHAYLTFDGEQHGFRRAETIRVALEAELSFYGQVFGFTPPGVPKLELRS